MAYDDSDLRVYYAQRAHEYEQVYAKPERQEDIARLGALLQDALAGQDVLEVACGTGYWTQTVARTARSILATDANTAVLDLARAKEYPAERVRFRQADALTLEGVSGSFTAGFAGFWWSHVARERLPTFLRTFHRHLGVGRRVVVADNLYVAGSNQAITRRDAEGNTYQRRTLGNGQTFEVLKNFPSLGELHDSLCGVADQITLTSLTHYWCLCYRIVA